MKNDLCRDSTSVKSLLWAAQWRKLHNFTAMTTTVSPCRCRWYKGVPLVANSYTFSMIDLPPVNMPLWHLGEGLYSCAQIVGGNILNVTRDVPHWRGFGYINGEVGGSLNMEEFWMSAHGGAFKHIDWLLWFAWTTNNTQFVNPNLTIVNGHIVLYFGQFNKFCYYLVLIELEAIQEYPVMLMAAIDPDNNVAYLHTCLSWKFYCIFTDNAHTTVINVPSSKEDEEKADLKEITCKSICGVVNAGRRYTWPVLGHCTPQLIKLSKSKARFFPPWRYLLQLVGVNVKAWSLLSSSWTMLHMSAWIGNCIGTL